MHVTINCRIKKSRVEAGREVTQLGVVVVVVDMGKQKDLRISILTGGCGGGEDKSNIKD